MMTVAGITRASDEMGNGSSNITEDTYWATLWEGIKHEERLGG